MAADTAHRVMVHHVERPEIVARQAIGVFDSGTGGLQAAAIVGRIVAELDLDISVVFFGDTANLPYGERTEKDVAGLADAIITGLAPFTPVIGIACNTASAAWRHFGRAGKNDPHELARRVEF